MPQLGSRGLLLFGMCLKDHIICECFCLFIYPLVFNIAMENHHAIKNGEPSISMGHLYIHLYHGKLLVITKGLVCFCLITTLPW